MKTVSAKQAIAQILKMNVTQSKLHDALEYEAGNDWYAKKLRNEKRSEKSNNLQNKINEYAKFITEEDYKNSELPCTLCQDWEDFNS